MLIQFEIMGNNSSKREISPTFKPNKRSKPVTPMTDESVEPLSTEQHASYPQISISLPDSPFYNPSISECSMPTIDWLTYKAQ